MKKLLISLTLISGIAFGNANPEMEKIQNRINELKSQIANLRAECDNASRFDKIWKCPNVAGQLAAPSAELDKLEMQLKALKKSPMAGGKVNTKYHPYNPAMR